MSSILSGFHTVHIIVPIVSKCVQAIGTTVWKYSKNIRDDPQDCDCPDRQHFYPGDRDNKQFLQCQAIRTVQNCPRTQQVLFTRFHSACVSNR